MLRGSRSTSTDVLLLRHRRLAKLHLKARTKAWPLCGQAVAITCCPWVKHIANCCIEFGALSCIALVAKCPVADLSQIIKTVLQLWVDGHAEPSDEDIWPQLVHLRLGFANVPRLAFFLCCSDSLRIATLLFLQQIKRSWFAMRHVVSCCWIRPWWLPRLGFWREMFFVLRLLQHVTSLPCRCSQGRTEFRWRPGQETSLAPPGSKCAVLNGNPLLMCFLWLKPRSSTNAARGKTTSTSRN